MKYDFETLIERRNTGSLKWHVGEQELPMWVADMDFQTAPEILKTIEEKVSVGIFGYSYIPKTWKQAYSSWWKTRHKFELQEDWILFCTGVIPAIDASIDRLTAPGEKILLISPVYNHFFISIEEHGRQVLQSQLSYEKESGKYALDFADLEKKLADPSVNLMIFSNPQNPTGNIWTREELEKIGTLCEKYGVTVISDEIHCDLTDPGYEYIPYASVSDSCRDNSITCIAPTKAFNIAGIQSAAVVIPNESLRKKIGRALTVGDIDGPNAFAVDAAIAAFTEGAPWLDALREKLCENKAYVKGYLSEQLPEIKAVPSHATYLMWLDLSEVTEDSAAFCTWLRQETGLFLNSGDIYGGNGNFFARLNIATQSQRIEDGMHRLSEGVKKWSKA